MAEYKKTFGFSGEEYDDPVLGTKLTLSGKCRVTFSCDGGGEAVSAAEDFLNHSIPVVISSFADDDIGYEKLPYLNEDTSRLLMVLAGENSSVSSSFAIKELCITELHPADSDYPRIIEAKRSLSVNTQGPVPLPQPAAAESFTPPEDGLYDIVLVSCPQSNKITIINNMMHFLGTGLAEAKKIVENAPQVIMSRAPAAAAGSVKAKFEGMGAVIELRRV